jgi:transglutaminase-like putative cysteine protease
VIAMRLSHTTRYVYGEPVSISFHQALLTPRDTPSQQIESTNLQITPSAQNISSRQDYYGNQVTLFTVGELHRQLDVEALTILRLLDRPAPETGKSPGWSDAVSQVRHARTAADLTAYEYCFDSPHVPTSPDLAAYASQSFNTNRPVLEAALDLNHRIYEEFRYDPMVTTISTPISEVLENKHGVCQDFAHFMLGCLRSLGIPARYISGYLVPNAGVVGAQASHAWVSVYSPKNGWVDFDPTNDVMPTNGHITLAWGRDYADVCPLRGIVLGGSEHTVSVGVSITEAD